MELRDLTDRYRLEAEIGRGSIGVVHRAVDAVLERRVAVKVMRAELLEHRRHRPRFLREGRVCVSLEHPNIVTVFDVGVIDVGGSAAAPCIVMELLQGRSLRTLLRVGRVSLGRMLSWFAQVCNGVAYAHDQGLIHRDIKPAHIFVGDYGQVVLTDWGLARNRPSAGSAPEGPPAEEVTRAGDIVGTPAYMAPEQAEGRIADLDHRVDIYALGAILYEILTGTRPFEASRSLDVLRALRRGPPDPPRVRAPHRDIPPALEAVCLRAMARDAGDRFESALDLAANLEAWFDARSAPAKPADRPSRPGGSLEAEETARHAHTHGEDADAARFLAEGRAEAAAFVRQLDEARKLATDAARLEAALPYEASPSRRVEVWRLENRARDTLQQAAWHLGQACDRFAHAEGAPGQRQAAREGLARLHRDAWRAAAEMGDVVGAGFHRARSEAYDDGTLSAELAGRSALSVHSLPAGAAVDICTVDDRGALWTTGARLRIGQTPLSGRTISASRVLLRIISPDGLAARLPLRVVPGESRVVEITLPRSPQVPPGFVFVAGGRFVFGADDDAPGAAEPRDVDVASFCISRQPVTWEEYFEFLEDLLAVGADARPHLPRLRQEPMVAVEDRHVRWLPEVYAPRGAPVRFVSHADAAAYAAWLGRRLGMPVRLPTEEEWEYAAGGADGRPFPWGARFVPGIADTRRQAGLGPEPVSAFADDESPFGMRCVAGGVREWTATPAEEAGRYLLRGGSWRAWPDQCRIGARAAASGDVTHKTTGIRLAVDPAIADGGG